MTDADVIVLPVICIERDAEQEADVLDALADIFPEVGADGFLHFLVELKRRGLRIVRVAA